MKEKFQGIILISLLIFMVVLAALGLYGMEMALFEAKMTRHSLQHNLLFNAAEYALNRTELSIIQAMPNCLISETDTHVLINRTMSWWNMAACKTVDKEYLYYYVVENLGSNGCALIDQSAYSKKITASYFRVTLLALPKKGEAKVILQSSVAKPDVEHDAATCEGTMFVIKLGRQMWRDITEDFKTY